MLVEHAAPDELAGFQLSAKRQKQLNELLAKNRDGKLTTAESVELDTFEQFEHVIRLLKARVRANQSQ
jgi:hypothetical protein